MNLTIAGMSNNTVISLTACNAATAAPTPNSAPTRLIPIVPPGAAPNRAIIENPFSYNSDNYLVRTNQYGSKVAIC